MKDLFREIKKDRTISTAFFVNMFFIFLTIIYVLFFYGKLPPFIPVFNQLPWGEQRLGDTITIFIPIIISLIIFLVNLFMSTLIYNRIPLISRMLTAISLLAGILTFLFIAKTITLIT